RAVLPTDLYGQPCDLSRIRAVCDRYGVPVVCDSAEAMGARYRWTGDRGKEAGDRGAECPISNIQYSISKETAGSRTSDLGPPTSDPGPPTSAPGPRTSAPWRHAGFGAWAAVFSFNGNKIITTSGGGMLASHDSDLIDHARKLSQQARDPAPWYQHTEIGFNYRMSNILAAIGRGQLEVLDERVARRREIFDGYRTRLGELPGISFMPEPDGCRGNRWLTVIRIDPAAFGADTHAVREALETENIEARPVWKPMHLQPVFQGAKLWTAANEAVSDRLFEQGLCLPSGTAMTDGDLDRVCGIIRRISA
ncbi:MAG: DegT/DnrJ/EryC1/StrS family aminotransferase, partial [Kiritimatiellae bacterium]|nr:DegT/DnrJ/EryC1/StrS family aminotransferase [Kiritimatiellia bacterium]